MQSTEHLPAVTPDAWSLRSQHLTRQRAGAGDCGRSVTNMRHYFLLIFLSVSLLFGPHTVLASEADSFGITREAIGDSFFTFRNGKLRHEISKIGDRWIEIFYDGSHALFVRAGLFIDGKPITTSERYPGDVSTAVRQVSLPGDAQTRRIYVSDEIYNRSETGFFEIIPNPNETLKESVILGPEFSTAALTELRQKLLSGGITE